MNRIVLIIVLLWLPVASSAERTLGDYDGNTWNEWDVSSRLMYVGGFIAGSEYVADSLTQIVFCTDLEKAKKTQGKFWASWDQKKPPLFSNNDVSDIICATDNNFNNSQIPRFQILNITVGQISDGINELFSDFKNRSIKLADAMYFVKKQIKGTPPDEIEKILLYLRSDKKDYALLTVKDENGKAVRYISFP